MMVDFPTSDSTDPSVDDTPSAQPPRTPEVATPTKSTNTIRILAIILVAFFILSGVLIAYKTSTIDTQPSPTPASNTPPTNPPANNNTTHNNQPTIPITINGQVNSSLVDTNQTHCFDANSAITCGQSFNGQDAQYQGNQPKYKDNGDGTVTDLNTSLTWIQNPGAKKGYYDAIASADSFAYAGYSDWRVPSIKELYSLMDFQGTDSAVTADDAANLTPFINDTYFDFEYGDTSQGDRIIDSQWVTNNIYVASVMGGQECFFGVNFADGRIKCYPTSSSINKGYFLRLVRGDAYGINDFVDNNDSTITDQSSSLMWQQADSEEAISWGDALTYCENLELAGYSDWRLPNAKELQYIVDYTRSPDTTNSPAIDPIFATTSITNEAGQKDYPFYWTSTTHIRSNGTGSNAVYIGFGRCLGYMNNQWMDVHGAGCQRSDPKSGNINDYPTYFGPQGDVNRLYNYARCVRGGTATPSVGADPASFSSGDASSQLNPQEPPASISPNAQQPPPEAISACTGKDQNASCSFVAPEGTITGQCLVVENQLACVPENAPPP